MKLQNNFLFLSFLVFTSCTSLSVRSDRSPAEQGLDLQRFSTSEMMPVEGHFRGQHVETERRRSLIFLTVEEKMTLGIPSDQLAFANFRHNQQFFIATIPGIHVDSENQLTAMENVTQKIIYSQKKWAEKIRKQTSSIEIHSELSLFLNSGHFIELWYNQTQNKKLDQVKALKEPIVFSVEAVRSAEEPLADFFPYALGSHFAIAERVVSNTERNQQHREDPDREIVSIRLNFEGVGSRLEGAERPEDAILFQALFNSNRFQRSLTYNALTNNCTNNLFILFDQVLRYQNDRVDTEIIRSHVNKYTQSQLPDVLEYIKNQKLKAVQNNIYLDSKVDQVIEELSELASGQAMKANVTETFMYSFPGFIEGHLKARGLMKSTN